MFSRTFSITTLVLLTVWLCDSNLSSGQIEERYWKLGVGCYYSGMKGRSDLDAARFDWICLNFGSISATKETVEQLNRLLKINPKLKFVVRLWPISGLGDCPENRQQATFLHYLYQPSVKQKLLQRTREQIRVVLDNIDKPQNVIAFTFLEELPGHFSGTPFSKNETGPNVSWDLERFRKEIEQERGKPLKWDDETRQWWIEKWVAVLGEIHATIKQVSNNRLVFYWLLTGRDTLDHLPAKTPTDRPRVLPAHLKKVIVPGKCDGLFGYPNNKAIWQNKYVRLAQQNNWSLFSQVSMPARMRLSSWPDTLKLAKQRFPQNLGYFLYVEGDEGDSNAWNVIPNLPKDPRWRVKEYSEKLLLRRHLAQENVGMDIVRAAPAISIQVRAPLRKAKPGSHLHLRAVLKNIREPTFFADPQEAHLRKAYVKLVPPPGTDIDSALSAPARIALGTWQPGEYRLADWWLTITDEFQPDKLKPVRVMAGAENVQPVSVTVQQDIALPVLQPHDIAESPWKWVEPGFELQQNSLKPRIQIEALQQDIRNPRVSNGQTTITYRGVLKKGQRLLLDPAGQHRLSRPVMLADAALDRQDQSDPFGYKSFQSGYVVVSRKLPYDGVAVKGGQTLQVVLEGQATGGAKSQLVLRCTLADGTQRDVACLVNRFNDTWQKVTGEVKLPAKAKQITNYFLYRLGRQGQIRYGALRLTEGGVYDDRLPESRLEGEFPTLSEKSLNIMQYEDDLLPGVTPRVRVQLLPPDRKLTP